MYYFIVNPASGSGKGKAVWQKVRAELDRLGVSYRAFLLSGEGEACRLAGGLSRLRHPATVVVVGGDGTINEVINGLTSFEHITFACIPTGSGNDFVRGLGLARDPLDALHAILHPKQIRPIDIGTVCCGAQSRTYSFAVSSGIGYDAAVCDAVHDSRLKVMLNRFHLGKLVYLLTALWQLLSMKRHTFTLTVDDSGPCTYENAYFAAAMNLRYEGGGFMFCPDALPDDGCLDLLIANNISRLRVLKLLPLAFGGKHVGHKGVHIVRCQKAVIRTPKPACVHTDGEIPGFCETITWTIQKEKLAVILR